MPGISVISSVLYEVFRVWYTSMQSYFSIVKSCTLIAIFIYNNQHIDINCNKVESFHRMAGYGELVKEKI